MNGYDEAIVLTADGHVSEGSAENLFIVRDGTLVTPPVTDNILEGITRSRLIAIAPKPRHRRSSSAAIDRTELYIGRRGLPVRHRGAAVPGRRGRPPPDRRPDGRGRSPAACRAHTSTRCADASTSIVTG